MTRTTTELERAAASLLSVGFHGKEVSSELRGLLALGVGGVIVFSRNVGSPSEVLALNRELKRSAARPLLLSVDQEGGQVARLRAGFTQLPAMRALGDTRDPELARAVGAVIGRELRAVGFDLDYAPVLDVDTNPRNPVIGPRAFGRTPELVSELGVALASGLQGAGVAACAKHFPGHGDTSQDSHRELPRLPHALERLERVELAPFRAAARAGIASVMTAHVIFEALDSLPATMSRGVVHGLLREKLGYSGLVVSDDLEMKAIADHYGIEQAMELGLNAGVDHFLCCHSAELAERAIAAVVKAVEARRLSRETLAAANQRFAFVLQRFAQPVGTEAELAVLRCEQHLQVMERVRSAARSGSEELAADPTEPPRG